MRRIKVGRFLLTVAASLTLLTQTVSAAATPMLNKYVNWNYGTEDEKGFNGYIPALDKQVINNPWQLDQWAGLFAFPDGQTRIVQNYDVFNVKKTSADTNFSKENGFGLVYKSQDALEDLFDAVWSGQPIATNQRQYFKRKFSLNADDPVFKTGHEYYYVIKDRFDFLRTAGIVQRMGIKFNQSQKVGNSYRALYTVSAWPELKVTNGNTLTVNYTGYGYTDRDIRIIAAPKGAFPDLSNVVSLTGGQYIHVSGDKNKATGTVKVNAKQIADVLGKNVDIIMDDGYGRTAIQSVILPDNQSMDYVPTKLTMTDEGQMWVKFRYDGEDIISSDHVHKNGIPNTLSVKIGGAITTEFNTGSRYTQLPQTLTKGATFNAYLGKLDVGKNPGKYYIKATAVINNSSHQERALEFPTTAYNNNSIKGEWMIEVKGPENDLIAQSITISPNFLKTGQAGTITAKVKNVGKQSVPNVRIRFYANEKQINETKRTLPANTSVTVGNFLWKGTEGIHSIRVVVDPLKESPDKDRGNNVATTGCRVDTPNKGGDYNECNNSNVNGEWNVTYNLITGYPEKTRESYYTDSDGDRHWYTYTYTDYTDPIWESRNVSYNENLKVNLEVNTKQGIPTDKKNPKETDRESRGSWAIIPWAKKQGLNPNEVTRAGYGFEVKVTTKYTNDWETKMPSGLEGTPIPFGGKYSGPTNVKAVFYDTKGKYVTTRTLVKTSGDDKTATWELPVESYRFSTGEEIYERKHYTEVSTPDGEYTVKIMASYAGRNQLSACATKKVTIYGSMYDDWQIRRDTSELWK
ncbi:hypothetical protein K3T49_28115 [Paenibacillus sonchi]|nr:hypothetical protein [Paenibacillus sonchi]